MQNLVVILGVPIDLLDMAQTIDYLEQLVEIGRRTGKGHQAVTVNVDFITNAQYDPHLLRLLQDASLAIPDGMPVVWGARSLGAPIRERVTGADLIYHLSERAAARGHSLYLLGAAPGVAARCGQHLAAEISRFTNLRGVFAGDPRRRNDRPADHR